MGQFPPTNQHGINMIQKQEVKLSEAEILEFEVILSLLSKVDQYFYKDLLSKRDDDSFKREVYEVLKYEFINQYFMEKPGDISQWLPFFKGECRPFWERLFKEESLPENIKVHISNALLSRRVILAFLTEPQIFTQEDFDSQDYEKQQLALQTKNQKETFDVTSKRVQVECEREVKSTSRRHRMFPENRGDGVQIPIVLEGSDNKERKVPEESQTSTEAYYQCIRDIEATIKRLEYQLPIKRNLQQSESAYHQAKVTNNKPNAFEKLFITNTFAWQTRAHELRQKALDDFLEILEPMDAANKIRLIDYALQLDLFSEHRSNYPIAKETQAVKTLNTYKNNIL